MRVPAPPQAKPAPSGPVFRTVRDKSDLREVYAV